MISSILLLSNFNLPDNFTPLHAACQKRVGIFCACQGLIDDKNLNFETGVLFKITDEIISDNTFSFQISKWRSGTGAIYYSDCKALKTGDSWEYSLGGFAIS